MTAAAYLLGYGALVTWCAPALLTRLTRRGLSPRLGIAAWLTAIAGVLLAWAAAATLLVAAVVTGFGDSRALVLCLELLGVPERVATPGLFSVLVVIVAWMVITTVVAVRVSRAVRGSRRRSHRHAEAARLVGVPTDRRDVFVITAQQPAAYCVVGRPDAIVVTSAAVEVLDESQLAAVLAHEDAHIAGRHHHVLMVLRALSASLRRLPLFTRGAVAVGELLEMCADDAAARTHGARPLVAGMVMLAAPVPAAGLGVAATGVAVRANRLLTPAHRGARWCHQLAMATMIAGLISTPVIVNLVCRH